MSESPATYTAQDTMLDKLRFPREQDFLQYVKVFAEACGWETYHTRDSRGSDESWPDLALWRAHTGEFLVAELKLNHGKVTQTRLGATRSGKTRVVRGQAEVLEQLETCGIEAHVWRPKDMEEIERRLRL